MLSIFRLILELIIMLLKRFVFYFQCFIASPMIFLTPVSRIYQYVARKSQRNCHLTILNIGRFYYSNLITLCLTILNVNHPRDKSSKKKLSTFYETLNLKPGCTKKDIRNSFIRLSKLNHPDICGPSSNDRFIRINEAYNILMDENKKNVYDETLRHNNNVQPVYYHYPKQQERNWKDAYNHPNNHWLSSNITIASFCLVVLLVGSIVRYYGVKKSTLMRSLLVEESDECLSLLEEQKLMKIDKTNYELIKMFERNIAKEYGPIIKK